VNSGDTIGGRYRLVREIGLGGTGRIWLAQDGRLDRRVAIKFLFAHTPAQQARFAKRVSLEAKIAASIQHPNVVQIFDFGTHESHIPYIVMEALAGFTLGDAFDTPQIFSLDTLIHIMSEVLRGLSAVHDAGIVHRDLKPENIFLVKESRGKLSPKLLDFGISRSLEPGARPSAVTTTEGMIVGTPEYMSPEQAQGDRHIDKRTDIYSIGTILFEALSGVVPFPSRSVAEALIAVIQNNAPPLYDLAPQLGRALCGVVDKAQAKNREKRYAHAAEMLDALLAATQQIPSQLDRQSPLFPPLAIRSRAQRRRGDESDDAPSTDASRSEPSVTVAAVPHATPKTVHGPAQRRSRRPYNPDSGEQPLVAVPMHATLPLEAAAVATSRPLALPRALWLALVTVGVFGVVLATVLTLVDRFGAPEGSGLIVVQAPSSSPATSAAQTPSVLEPRAAAGALAALEETRAAAPANKKAGAGKPRKAPAADPMQLLAASVADAFSKQKAGVIACLNEHAPDLEGAPQLKVRLMIDRNGVASNAELLPATIASKPVAGCLRAAVTKMSFPRPEQPTTFSVPLLWRRK
jgi:serine/threonine protein kinase